MCMQTHDQDRNGQTNLAMVGIYWNTTNVQATYTLCANISGK